VLSSGHNNEYLTHMSGLERGTLIRSFTKATRRDKLQTVIARDIPEGDATVVTRLPSDLSDRSLLLHGNILGQNCLYDTVI
jgi:hypothetical protein